MEKETIALIATLTGVALGVVGLLTAWYWQHRRSSTKLAAEAHNRSVAAGQEVTGQVATGDQSTVAGQADVVIGAGSTTHIQKGLSAEDHDRLVRIEDKLDQWGKHAAPPGASTPDTSALAAADVTERTDRLLAEAVELQRQHKEREAIERLLTAYDMEMPPEAKAELHLLAGNGFARLSEFEQAEVHYLRSLAAAEEASDDGGRAAALGNLGNIYAERGLMDKAEHYYKRALVIDEEIEDYVGVANALGNLGIVYRHRGDLEQAESHHRKGLAIHEELGDRLGQANHLGDLGLVYQQRGDPQQAESHHRRALAIDKEIGNKLGQALDLGSLGFLAEQQGDAKKARELLLQAEELLAEMGAGGTNRKTIRAALQRLQEQD
jgi:tetratricopeptide (TPR) repeat protein